MELELRYMERGFTGVSCWINALWLLMVRAREGGGGGFGRLFTHKIML